MKKHVSTLVCLFTVYLILQTFKVFAQTSQPQNTPRPGSSYTPHSSGTCSEPLPFGNTAPEPYCQPGYTANDTFPYIVPCKDVTDRNTCRIRDGAAIGNGFDWHNVDSINYKSGNYVIQTSNQKSLLYEVRGNEIFFIQDTTWSNSTQCSNGKPAFQRINERNGMLWATRSLSCAANNSYSSQGTNAGFEYSESQEESLRLLPDNVTPCSAPHTGDVSGRKHLIFNGNAKCGSFSGDILVIRNMEGAGAGEVFIYCKDVGLCGWYQNINFSDPENNPRNWVGKDICANTAFGHDYGSCYVDCHPEGINQPVPLSVSQQIQIQTARSLNINLLNLQPADGNHKIAIKEQRHLDGVLRSMLPDTYKIQKKGETQPILQNNQKLIKLNQNNVDVTIRSNIKVHGDQIIITGNATDQNSIQITTQGSTQLATSEDILWNNKDCEDCREQDDFNKLLGSISSRNKTTLNTPQGIDLTKPAKRLADRIEVPDQSSQMMKTDSQTASPENQNRFIGQGGGPANFVINIVSNIVGTITQAIGVTSNTTLASCTRISNDDDLYNNTRNATYAFLPHRKTQEFERMSKAGAEENPYTNPIAGSGGGNTTIEQAYYPTNFVNATLDAQKCSALPHEHPEYRNMCRIYTNLSSVSSSIEFPGSSNPGTLDYDIPFKNTSCMVNENTINSIVELMPRYYPNYYTIGVQNLRNLWREIQNSAINQGINPSFALTLYIEESAACGAIGSYGMGCIYERHTSERMSSCSQDNPETSLSQVSCLASYVSRAQNFTGFMCRYSGERRDSNDQCTSFTNNPNFPNGVRFWYNFITEGQSSDCQMTRR